jgi:GR25 family glycosyltransferase involved in LPS biosynthesis
MTDQHKWEIIAITLDTESERFKTFAKSNDHLEYKVFRAINGKDISDEEKVSQGLVSKRLVELALLTPGIIGNAASHKTIWKDIIDRQIGALILEDDAYTHPNIADFIEDNIDLLMDIDILFFGVNTDTVMASESPEGLQTFSRFSPIHPDPEWIKSTLSKTNKNEVKLHRLFKSLGVCAYFITPSGAENLLNHALPLSLKKTTIPLPLSDMYHTSIDRAGCAVYPHIKAYVSQPFLAYTPNIDSSTK